MQGISSSSNFQAQPRKLNLQSINPKLDQKLKEFDPKNSYSLKNLDERSLWCNAYHYTIVDGYEQRTFKPSPEEAIMYERFCTKREALHIIYQERDKYRPNSIWHLKPYFDFLDSINVDELK